MAERTSTRDTTADVRPLRLPRDARRSQLVEAARSVFVSKGYHAAAMDDIAERAGVSKPVVYQHFAGKLDLYLVLLDESCELLVTTIREAIDSSDDNAERVAATVEAYFAFVDEGSEDYRLVFETDIANVDRVQERLEQLDRACSDAIADAIGRQTALAGVDSDLLGRTLVGMARVGAQAWLGAGRPYPRGHAAELVAGLAWRGLSGVPVTVPTPMVEAAD